MRQLIIHHARCRAPHSNRLLNGIAAQRISNKTHWYFLCCKNDLQVDQNSRSAGKIRDAITHIASLKLSLFVRIPLSGMCYARNLMIYSYRHLSLNTGVVLKRVKENIAPTAGFLAHILAMSPWIRAYWWNDPANTASVKEITNKTVCRTCFMAHF